MSDTGTTRENRAVSAPGRGRAVNIALWVLQVFLALVFVAAGLTKVFGDPAMVEMFATIGIGQWFRYLVGVLELAGAVGVLVPRVSGLVALGLVCLMVGATFTNVFILDTNTSITLALTLVSMLVVWGRWPKTRALLGVLGH